MPFRLQIESQCCASLDQLKANAATCDGIERIQPLAPHGGKVAIVGGGPSVTNHLDELRNWEGPIWAINNTASWLIERGIPAIYFSVDPSPHDTFKTDGVTHAVLATCCDPKLRERFAEVAVFDMVETHPDGITGGTTSVSRACTLAIRCGFYDVTLFGVEGSFALGQDHVDRHQDLNEILVVRAGGKDYATYPEFLLQCEALAPLIQLAPNVFKQKSGGLLEAVVNYPDDWECVAVSAKLRDHLIERNGDSGIFTTPYEFEAA